MAAARAVWAFGALQVAHAQQAGTEQEEVHPPLDLQQCSAPGACEKEVAMLTLDSQRRWLHNKDLKNCFEGDDWDGHICPSAEVCARECMLEGIEAAEYQSTYGVTASGDAVDIQFIVNTDWGKNVGSRLYMMDSEDTYKVFRLKNMEFAFDVDVSSLPCGLNAALYLVEMSADGGKGAGNGAGAKFGTGYCDAQCPRALRFIDGEANLEGWKGALGGATGSCCAEMDLFEANKMGGAFTAHPCRVAGPSACNGVDCGDADAGNYYKGVCDKDGCDFNPYRLGAKEFYGPGLRVDPTKPFTVVTQFLTADGSDAGDLAEIRRYFVQDGEVIENAEASGVPGVEGNSITNAFCAAQKEAFHECRVKNNPEGAADQFNELGGLKAMGQALDRGMVLVLSLWDDPATSMHWLDSVSPSDLPESTPGVVRGPCPREAGLAESVEASASDAAVKYSSVKYGPLGSTTPGVTAAPLSKQALAPLPDTPHASAPVSADGMQGGATPPKPAFVGAPAAAAGVAAAVPAEVPAPADAAAAVAAQVPPEVLAEDPVPSPTVPAAPAAPVAVAVADAVVVEEPAPQPAAPAADTENPENPEDPLHNPAAVDGDPVHNPAASDGDPVHAGVVSEALATAPAIAGLRVGPGSAFACVACLALVLTAAGAWRRVQRRAPRAASLLPAAEEEEEEPLMVRA